MRFQFMSVGAALLLLTACSSDPDPEPECGIGERCECTTTADCPDPSLEMCDLFQQVCVPSSADSGRDDTGGSDAGDGDTTLADADDTGSDIVVPNDVEDDGSGDEDAALDVIETDGGSVVVEEEGACTNQGDLELLSAYEGNDLIKHCATGCIESEGDLTTCTKECFRETALTQECMSCHDDSASCMFQGCDDICSEGIDQCVSCILPNMDDRCRPAFNICVGLWDDAPLVDACLNDDDIQRIESQDPRAGARECVAGCDPEESDCAANCIQSETGLSQNCSECFAGYAQGCEESEACDCSDPSSETCTTCLDNACLYRLSPCSGLYNPEDLQTTVIVAHLAGGVREVIAYKSDDNDELGGVLAFGMTDLVSLPAFEDGVVFRSSLDDPDTPPLASGEFDGPFVVDEVSIVALIGQVFAEPITRQVLRVTLDTSPLEEGASVRFVNAFAAATDASLWDITVPESPVELVDAIAFGAVSGSFDLALNEEGRVIGVDLDGDGSADAAFSAVLDEGLRTTLWLADAGEQPVLFAIAADGHVESWPAQDMP